MNAQDYSVRGWLRRKVIFHRSCGSGSNPTGSFDFTKSEGGCQFCVIPGVGVISVVLSMDVNRHCWINNFMSHDGII